MKELAQVTAFAVVSGLLAYGAARAFEMIFEAFGFPGAFAFFVGSLAFLAVLG